VLEGDQAYDARQRFLTQVDLPVPEWSTDAVVYALRKELLSPPWLDADPDHRLRSIEEKLAELDRRGFDSSAIVRYGFGDRLIRALTLGLAIYEVFRLQQIASGKNELPPLPPLWTHLIDPERPAEVASVTWPISSEVLRSRRQRLDTFTCDLDDDIAPVWEPRPRILGDRATGPTLDFVMRRLHNAASQAFISQWLAGATLRELITWSGRPAYPSCLEVPVEIVERYVWVVERMTSTFFGRWTTSSLRLEQQWSDGRVPPPCPAAEMTIREIPSSDLQYEIASRATALTEPDSQGLDAVSLGELVRVALVLIEDGERDLAAALFDAARTAEPESAEAHNNYGFCILPDDPQRALPALRRSEGLGFANGAINLVNQVQAHLLLGQNRAAIAVAEQLHRRWDRLPRAISFIWALDGNSGPRLIQVLDPRPVAYALAALAADQTGDESAARWRKRHDEHCKALNIECRCMSAAPH